MTAEVQFDIDQEIADVLERVASDAPPEQSELDAIWLADSRRTAFGMMRALAAAQRVIDDHETYLAMVEDETRRAIAPMLQRAAWLKAQLIPLCELLLPPGTKHVDFPAVGRAQFRDYQASLRIDDPDAFIAALGAEERARLVEMKPKLLTVPAKAYAQQVLDDHGELMPGVERVEAHREASISTEGSR